MGQTQYSGKEFMQGKDTSLALNGNGHYFTDQAASTLEAMMRASENAEQEMTKKETPPKLEDFEYLRITLEKEVPHHEPVIRIGDKGIAARRNITGISAQVKAGKTALSSVILAGAISQDGEIEGFNDMHVEPNRDGKAVIDIDTEQAEDDQQYKVKTILRRSGFSNTPDNFLSYNFRQLTRANYKDALNPICNTASERFNGVHLIVIDGGADFCQSVNDDKEAAAAVEYFTHLSIEYDCPVIIVVHQNPGSEKERGHFGSEIQRKCYGLISIVKNGDISTASVKVGRKAGTTDTPLIHYCYDSAKGYHTDTEEPDIDHNKAIKNRKKHLEVAERVFSGQSSYKHNEAVRLIMDVRSCSEKTAKTMLQNMVGWGQVIHQGEFYRKNMTGVTKGNSG